MKKLVFATNNPNKLKELQAKLPSYDIISLKELGVTEDIPETGLTLEENALIKARYLVDKFNIDCFADDTGLEIEALDNRPGIYSARYAGEDKSAEKNMEKVLAELAGKENRKARFRTAIALIQNGKETLMDGIVEGKITETKIGDGGFGYDPIFVANGFDITFAQMDMETKNRISHRGLAVDKLVEVLKG
ncbi:MAG: non-canonical purine NTP diphosphatase [Flavobacteriales bacterium]